MKDKILNSLKYCGVRKRKKYIEIELPVILYFNYQRLVLRIYPIEDGYYISDDGKTFIEYSSDTEYYYNLFMENDKNYHYDIQLDNGYIYKQYDGNYSVIAAIDEFIKYFINLNDYMQANDVV